MKRFKEDGTPTHEFEAFMRRRYRDYMMSNDTSIYDAYAKPSQEKIDAMENIRSKAYTTPYIISYNAFIFTVAYFIFDESLDCELFVVETKDNVYVISEDYL